MNTSHTLASLLEVFRQAFDKAAETAFEPVRGVRPSRDAALEAVRSEALKAVLDAIGYQFPVDPEREAYDKWADQDGSTAGLFEAWKAGRDDLRKSFAPTTVAAPIESKPETFEAHGHTWFKHNPGDPKPEYLADDVGVNWLLEYELGGRYTHDSLSAGRLTWRLARIVGWRYAK